MLRSTGPRDQPGAPPMQRLSVAEQEDPGDTIAAVDGLCARILSLH